MANIQDFHTYLAQNDIQSITELIETRALTDKHIEICLVKDIENRNNPLFTLLLKHYDNAEIAKSVATVLGRLIYASKTSDALFVINQLTPSLGDNDWMDSDQYPPLNYAVHFNNIEIINALTPKLTLKQLERTSASGETALSYAINGRKSAAVKAICKRGLQLLAETQQKQAVTDVAHKLIQQINGENVFLSAKESALAEKSLLKKYYLAYLRHCSQSADFNALRQVFFDTFNYLDNNNKRLGFFTNVFGNHALSRAITQAVNTLKDQITHIDSNGDQPMTQLLNLVEESIKTVRQLRSEHASVYYHFESGPSWGSNDGWHEGYNYKKPYANGAFEKKLIAALEMIKPDLYQPSIQQRIDRIIEDVNNYKPTEVRFNVDSYAP